jgi:Methyltransferase domain
MSDPDTASIDTSKPINGGSTAPMHANDSSTTATTNAELTVDHCLSQEEFQAWLLQRLQQNHTALYGEYPQVFESAAAAITNWRRRFHGDAALWKRLFEEKKIIKEFVEACPIIDAVQRLVRTAAEAEAAACCFDKEEEGHQQKPFTIVDLACGKGYLSMLLAEMLPPMQVTRFVLMDKAWACHGTTELSPHHMNWDHIHEPKYKDSWPIPLVPCKQDLKSARQRRKLQQHYFDKSSNNNVILLAVHLCGTLSLKAVDFFNQNANISFFCLKPCCLPGMIHAKRHEIFTMTNRKDDEKYDDDSTHPHNKFFEHSFPAKSVCMHGKWKKNKWQGPPRQSLIPFFQTWSDNLFLGIAANPVDTTTSHVDGRSQGGGGGGTLNNHASNGADKSDHDDDVDNYDNKAIVKGGDQQEESSSSSCCLTAQKLQRTIMVQIDGGYQNEFLFAQRFPTTAGVWKALIV